MMAVMNHATEFPDFDKLLNATEDEHCNLHSSSRDNEINTPFDPNEFATLIGWYRQRAKNFDRPNGKRLELEKQKLAQENEISFLEDVQSTFESLEHMSDFASLSIYSHDVDLDKPSMLKDLLLSPYSGKYSREVNSPEHKNQDIVSYGNSSPCHSSHRQSSAPKPKTKKRSKNFPELLKHMEPTKDKNAANKLKSKPGKTRLVSNREYTSRYGTSDKVPPVMETEQVEPTSKRVLVDPVTSKKGNARQTLTLTLKSSTAAKILDGKAKDASDSCAAQADAAGTGAVVDTAGSSQDKTPHGSVKRSLSAGEPVPAKKVCLDTSPVDHDYCTGPAIATGPRQDDRANKDQDKPVQKVPWQRYLHRQRNGVQSAPVSPSAPAGKNNTKKPTNFMVVPLQNAAASSKVVTTTVDAKGGRRDAVPVPLPLQKSAVKTSHRIKTFDDYMAELRDNLKSPKPAAPPQNHPPTNYMICSQSLAAIAQKHQRKSAGSGPAQNESISLSSAKTVSPMKSPGHPGQLLTVKVPVSSPGKSGKVVTCASTVSRVSGSGRDRVGGAAKSVPAQSQHYMKPESRQMRVDNALKSDCKVSSVKGMNNQPGRSNGTDQVKCGSDEKPMSVTLCDDVQRDARFSPPRNKGKGKVPGASPTFKLMASDKDGGRGKSLILSNVGGQLKELLTQLAEQQAKLKEEGRHGGMDNDQQQIKILRDLIACLMAKGGAGDQPNQSTTAPVQTPHSEPRKDSAILTNGYENGAVEIVAPRNASVVGEKSESNADLGLVNSPCVENRDEGLVVMQGQTVASGVGLSANDMMPVDNDPAVITLEDALMRLDEDDELENCQSNQPGDANVAVDENLFCKLPSYFLNGKLVNEEKSEESQLRNKAMKTASSDPLFNCKSEAGLEFDKLPHYLSSGKTSWYPDCKIDFHDRTKSGDSTLSKKKTKSKEYAVKLSHVTEDQHLTAQGTPVDTSQTYYSRLPSYYSYGRPHPPVKTFNDDAADAKDDTVTQQTLQSDAEREQRPKKKKSKKKKKRKTKREDGRAEDETSEKILYSKLPSYYMSSKVLKHRRDNGRAASPRRSPDRDRSPRPRSYSPRSDRSRSRSRSSCRNSRSRKRYRSRSYSSRSPSYSSGSDSESRRSWRQERRSGHSRSSRSHDRRSYDTSDEDRDDCRWRRERETRRAKRQHRDNHEKENQQAMEERRVVYVGGIDDKMTKHELRSVFLRYGTIEKVTLFFRTDRDNYGFVTFQYTCDAFRAIEEGANLAPNGGRYDLCFGGRRQFCKSRYEDLDSKVPQGKGEEMDDFDAMLQRAKRGLRH